MRLIGMILISLMVGFVGAGLVWFGWGLAENLSAMFRSRKAAGGKARAEDSEQTETEISTEVGPEADEGAE